ncbi:MAG: hypothetical protein QM607_08400 [Microbacterium sp.]
MALDGDLIDLTPGTIVRVGTGVWRAFPTLSSSPAPLTWLCVRAGGGQVDAPGYDAEVDRDRL